MAVPVICPTDVPVMVIGVNKVKPAGNVIPVWVPVSNGASAALNAVVIRVSATNETAQYCPAGIT